MEDALQPFTQTADGVWAVDMDQRIVLWNRAAEDLLGYAPEQAIGRLCYQLLGGRDPAGRPFCQNGCTVTGRARQNQPVGSFDLQVRHLNGRVSWVNVSIITMPLKAKEDNPLVLVHLFHKVGEGPAWCPSLRIHLLGPVTVQRADGSLVGGPRWRRARTRALLTFLALRRGEPAHRSIVIEALWPHLEHEAALNNLNVTVYYLRRSLEPGLERGVRSCYVHYEQDCYALAGGHIHWLDVHAFESGIAQARHERDPDRATQRYQETLALYRGEFVADLEPDLLSCWMERERLQEFYLRSMEELAALHTEQQLEQEATELLLKVLALDSCREMATQQLMRLALRRGDRAAASAHYRRMEKSLWRELELAPSQETRALYERASR